jgi:hypothetical protein
MEQALAERLDRADASAEILERFITVFGNTVNAPILYHSGKEHYGFRFGAPNIRHFCLLKGVRALSAWRASAVLARQGYVQEVFVLLRTLTEFTTHIEYVLLARDKDGTPTEEAATYLQAFFADFARNDETDFGRIKLKQGAVHRAVGASFDAEKGELVDPTERMFSRVYRTLSNYVHGRYPEIMDLYGGNPPRWHASGMSGTPKDAETVEFVATSLGTVSQSFRLLASALNLKDILTADPALLAWYESGE